MFSRSKTTPPAAPPDAAAEVQALAAQLSSARGRLELLGGDASMVLTEVPSETELAEARRRAEWRRKALSEAEQAELAEQLAAAESLRRAEREIREADIRDVIEARKALAEQRRAETPASTVASLRRHSRWTRYGCAAIITAGMLWSAINVQQNMAPGGTGDPMFWVSYLVEAMISGLLVIIAIGTAKNREAAGVEPSPGIQWAEVGLFLLTLTLNTYPYVRATHWYEASLHAIAPLMIGVTLLVLHALTKDYAHSRAIVSAQVGDVALPDLPAIRPISIPVDPQPAPTQVPATPAAEDAKAHTTASGEVPMEEFEREFVPAPHLPVTESAGASADTSTPSAGTPHLESAGQVQGPRTSSDAVTEPALRQESAGSAGTPHSASAGEPTPVTEPATTVPAESADTPVEPAEVVATPGPAPARTATSTAPTSTDPLESAGSAGQVRGPRTSRPRLHPAGRTSTTAARTTASAGAGTRSALALAAEESAGPAVPSAGRSAGRTAPSAGASAGGSAQVRGDLIALAEQVRARRVGQRLPVETVVRVLAMAGTDSTTNAIHQVTGVHRKTIDRIRETAIEVRTEAAQDGDGGRVIELRKPTDQP